MYLISKMALVGLALCITSKGSPAQNTGGHPIRKERGDWSSFSRLLERAMKKVEEAVALERKRRYAAAEAVCQEAMDILELAPFAQLPVKETFAQIYIDEGLYEEAYKMLRPLYQPTDTPTELGCMLIISCCHTSRLSLSVDVLRALYRQNSRLLWFTDEAGLPTSPGITPDNMEATAYLIWGDSQPGSPRNPDGLPRIETAIRLAPRCGAAYYSLARWRSYFFEPNAVSKSETVTALYRKAWQLGDPFLRKQHFPFRVPSNE
jgi:hypothetical protein